MRSPAVFVCLVALISAATAKSPSRPHIVFIIADDLGWDDVGFHGSDISTPNIDALAYSGIILNKYYVSPICSPTRSAIMSGRHPIHTGMQVGVIGGANPYGLSLNNTILPQYLQQLGYRRHSIGKWHLGFFEEAYLPTRRGFESFLGYYCGHEDYFDHEAQDSGFFGLDIHRNEDALWDVNGNFSTEMYTREAENIIAAHDPSEPLFLYLAHQAVHAGNGPDPLQVPQKYVNRFKSTIHDAKRRIFAGMVSALDDSVGRVVDALKTAGLYNDTILVFTTDNGGPANGFDGNAALNWPLRGTKDTMWEGGVRGVGLVHSPLLNNSNYVSNNFFHITDWLPTLYRAAGGDPSTLKNIDGIDLFEMLDKNGEEIRKEVLHNIDPVRKFASLRVGDYKLVEGHVSDNNNWYPPPGVSQGDLEAEVKVDEGQSIFGSPLKFGSERGASWGVSNSKPGSQRVEGHLHISRSENLHTSRSEKGRPAEGPIVVDCGKKPANASANCKPEKSPCLFHIPTDPCEYNNIAHLHPMILWQLQDRLNEYRKTMVAPANTPVDPKGNPYLHGGVWQPWIFP